ncbi:MAG: Dihydroorotase [Bacteroidota bacterium]|jgi:dihydroorotase
MKKLVISSATILHPDFKGKSPVDVLISDGKIIEIADKLTITDAVQVIDASGCFLSIGFCDLNVNFGEPGLETKETMNSGSRAALAGGVTALALMPNTQPPLHSKSEVAYVVNRSAAQGINVYPLGTISEERKGENLAELYDMSTAGAIAFSDGDRPVKNAGLMSKALLYAKGIGTRIFSYAEDPGLAGSATVNEGPMSTLLGLKGNPTLAEELMISRDIELAAYHDTGIHFSTISSARSVQLIREAKAKGLKITCDVAVHHLVFTDDDLAGFDSNFKVKPPLRSESDRQALLAGLRDGTIDALVSQHTPQEIEHKNVEFALAAYGITGLQTILPMCLRAGLKPAEIVEKLAINPRKILGLPVPKLAPGESAELVLFDPKTSWVFDRTSNLSLAGNHPLMGEKLTGKVLLTCNKGQVFLSKS